MTAPARSPPNLGTAHVSCPPCLGRPRHELLLHLHLELWLWWSNFLFHLRYPRASCLLGNCRCCCELVGGRKGGGGSACRVWIGQPGGRSARGLVFATFGRHESRAATCVRTVPEQSPTSPQPVPNTVPISVPNHE